VTKAGFTNQLGRKLNNLNAFWSLGQIALSVTEMKQSEIIPRQNRIIYVLMAIVAILALFWATWEHTDSAGSSAQQHHLSKTDTVGKSVITVQSRKK
jgi:hypothetical protein